MPDPLFHWTAKPPARLGRLGAAILLLVMAAVLVAMRLHAFVLPLETDECNYAYIGARLIHGDRLYVDVWDHQPPGVFGLFAAATAVFGGDQAAFRWLATAAALVSMLLLYVIVRRAGGVYAGCLAAALWAISSADPGTAGEGCNREVFMNPLALAAVWMLLRRDVPRAWETLLAGLVLGFGSTIKTVMAVQWLVLAAWLVVWTWLNGGARFCDNPPSRDREGADGAPTAPKQRFPDCCTIAQGQVAAPHDKRLRAAAANLLLFSAGPALVWAAIFGYFAATGRLANFYEATFQFNLSYADVASSYWQRFADFFRAPVHRYVFDGTSALWIAAGFAVVALPILRRSRGLLRHGALPAYLLGSYWAVCLPGQLWPHYYYLMLPPLIAVLATALGQLAVLPAQSPAAMPAKVFAVGAAGVVFVSLVWAQVTQYLLVPTLQLTEARYDSRDLWAKAQGENVAKVTDPDDTVFVYSHDAGVYYYSKRRCASRYTMVRALQEQYPGFDRRRVVLLAELQTSRPRVVLLVEEPFPALYAFLWENYTPVGVDYHDRRPDEPIMQAWMDKNRPLVRIDWNWHRSSVRGRE